MGTLKLLVRPPLLAALLLAITTQAGCREFAGYEAGPDLQRGPPDLGDAATDLLSGPDAVSPPPKSWSFHCEMPSGAAEGAAVAVDDVGNAYVAGSIKGDTDVLCGKHLKIKGDYDALLLKLSPTGEVLWAKTFGGPGMDAARAVATAPNGAIYLAGHFSGVAAFGANRTFDSGSEGALDGFIMRLDEHGGVSWVRQAHGQLDQKILAVAADESGVTIGGWYEGKTLELRNANGDAKKTLTKTMAHDKDLFVAKYDDAGAPRWLTGASGNKNDAIEALALGVGGRVYAAGYFNSSTLQAGSLSFSLTLNIEEPELSRDAIVLALDSQGAISGGVSFGGAGPEEAHGVVVGPMGAPIVTGWSQSDEVSLAGKSLEGKGLDDLFVVKLSADAKRVDRAWMVGSPGRDAAFEIARCGDSLVVVGTSGGSTGDTHWDVGDGQRVLVGRLDPQLRSVGVEGALVGGEGRAWGVAALPNQELVVTGYFKGSFKAPNGQPLTTKGDRDLFVWRLPAP